MVKFEIDLDTIYPIGSIYMSINDINPKVYYGGEWEQIKDRFLLACGTKHPNGEEDGSEDAVVVSHNHTQAGHTHEPSNTNYKFLGATTNISINGTKRAFPSSSSDGHHFVYTDDSTGGINEYATTSSVAPTINSKGESGIGKNMPPFLAVYMWVRTG